MNDKLQRIFDDIKSSTKKVTVLQCDDIIKQKVKQQYTLNPKSVLGILLDNVGGIVIDDWIRIYGSGELDIISRNVLFPYDDIVIGEDILGGLFIYLENGNIGYFAPDCLEIENMEMHFNQFLYWCLYGNTDGFYIDYKWTNWQTDVLNLNLNEGIAFYPFLWAKADNLENRKRTVVPMNEIIGLELDFFRQFQEKQ